MTQQRTRESSQTLGLIGLGRMGRPMGQRLADAGYRLVVTDVRPAAISEFISAVPQARVAEAPDAFGDVDTLITMLPDSDAVDAALLHRPGAAASLARGCCVIDMSSSQPQRSRALAARLAESGIDFLDAPVSGGVARAQDGRLAVMVGGDAEVLASRRGILERLGSTITHVGGVGAGHAAKALNNYVSAAGLVATSEALHVATRFGIDPELMVDVLNASSGRNNTTENKARQFMLSGSFASGFALGLMAKDLGIAMGLGRDIGVPMRLGEGVSRLWNDAANVLPPDSDHTEMHRYLQPDQEPRQP